MMKLLKAGCAALGLFGVIFTTDARADEITVLCSTAMKAAIDVLAPMFEKQTGTKVVLPYDSSAVTQRKLAAGEAFDVALTGVDALESLVAKGLQLADKPLVVSATYASLAYPVARPAPDISTPEKLKSVVLGAKSMSYSDPALGGGSSNYFAAIAERLGIQQEIRQKVILTKPGQGAFPVADGRAEIGVAQASEIALVNGVAGVPIFPNDPRSKSITAAGISSSSRNMESARAFVTFLLSPKAIEIFRDKGLHAE